MIILAAFLLALSLLSAAPAMAQSQNGDISISAQYPNPPQAQMLRDWMDHATNESPSKLDQAAKICERHVIQKTGVVLEFEEPFAIRCSNVMFMRNYNHIRDDLKALGELGW